MGYTGKGNEGVWKPKSVGEGEYASVLDLVTSLPRETMLARILVLEVLKRTRKKKEL